MLVPHFPFKFPLWLIIVDEDLIFHLLVSLVTSSGIVMCFENLANVLLTEGLKGLGPSMRCCRVQHSLRGQLCRFLLCAPQLAQQLAMEEVSALLSHLLEEMCCPSKSTRFQLDFLFLIRYMLSRVLENFPHAIFDAPTANRQELQ